MSSVCSSLIPPPSSSSSHVVMSLLQVSLSLVQASLRCMAVYVENSPSTLSLSPELSNSALQILDLSIRQGDQSEALAQCGLEATRVMTEVTTRGGVVT